MKASVFLLTLLLFTDGMAGSSENPWALVVQPTKQAGAKSIGTYSAGCLAGAVELPFNGAGYQLMRLSRKRYYGHPDLIHFIEHLSQSVAQEHLGVLLIGDLGQPRGGPTLSGHRSHQTGLDVDIWFMLSEQAVSRVLANNERETWSAHSVLLDHSDGIDGTQWTRANEQILEMASAMPEVDRVFVNPSIKRQLCKSAKSREWLRKIRPWWGHDDHFHVRLKCPKDSPYCQDQEPLPYGDGCAADLAWWFSAEAKAPAARPLPERMPRLPPQCAALLKE